MKCEQAKPLIPIYADGELDAARAVEIECHIQDCAPCAASLRNLKLLKKSLKNDALFFTPPSALRSRIVADLRANSGQRRSLWNWRWLAPAITGLATACVAVLLTLAVTRPSSSQQQLAQEVVSSHVRSLQPNHTLDVVSTDQHTVKPWFNGRLDFSPPVKDLAAQNFPLTGGRLEYLAGHPAAALIFQRNKHVINLFIWPSRDADSAPASSKAIQGYNLIHWSNGGMTFWAVSDLNLKELQDFAAAFNGA